MTMTDPQFWRFSINDNTTIELTTPLGTTTSTGTSRSRPIIIGGWLRTTTTLEPKVYSIITNENPQIIDSSQGSFSDCSYQSFFLLLGVETVGLLCVYYIITFISYHIINKSYE